MLAYFDCFSGISGDMTLGALVDLGVPPDFLEAELQRLPLDGFELAVGNTERHGIRAKQVEVRVAAHAPERDYAAICALINASGLAAEVKKTSLAIFDALAAAEAEIHNCPKEKVHFHELGAVDAIVDIVGTALGLDFLKIERVTASRIPLGQGFVTCRHGTLPVPAPATLGILKNVPVYGSGVDQELVTPTGAGIVATLAESFGPMPEMVVDRIGYGAGRRRLTSRPNLLRIVTGTADRRTAAAGPQTDAVTVLETCIDDMNPELFGFVMERLFAAGALDVYWIPVFMKKNRPGTMIQVLCRPQDCQALAGCILAETTTAGVRFYDARRYILERELVEAETAFGRIQVKRIAIPGGGYRLVPEYEVCRRIALEQHLPLRTVYDTIAQSLAAQGAGSF